MRNAKFITVTCKIWMLFLMGAFSAVAAPDNDAVLAASGVKGGLIVYIGCENPERLLETGTNETYLVHALDTDSKRITKARKYIHAKGVYGKVSVDTWDGKRLPYADNLVNLLVISNIEHRISNVEVMRVLVPGGKLISNNEYRMSNIEVDRVGKCFVYTKPVPPQIDEWGHYLHGSDGNPVANDDVVHSPKQLQWVNSPEWGRHHEHMASMNALVSSGGRVFSICDEGPRRAMLHPPQWKLSAHDAFNGIELWEREIDEWYDHLHRLKKGPASLPRRLVADDKQVYVTLGINAPVSVLDATTGKTLKVCKGSEGTQEIILSGGVLFLVRGVEKETFLMAVDPVSGSAIWDKKFAVASLTLTADKQKVVFFSGENVVALNRKDGSVLWESEPLPEKSKATWMINNPPRLILGKGAVVVSPGKKSMYAISGETGKLLWTAEHPRSGCVSPKDLFIIDGLVWYGDTAGAKNTGIFYARNIMTGKIEKSFAPDIDAVWLSHHRCHFSKATRNYILPGRMGVEFVDIKNESWQANQWFRGGCIYGVMPCNGLLYLPPHACACYFEAKHHGFSALTSSTSKGDTISENDRLQKGEAYAWAGKAEPQVSVASDDWPVFRHDATRSGSSPSTVPAELKPKWSVALGGKLTQPVTAGGKVYVASVHRHTLYALDAETGAQQWQFTAGARIDSPPSIHKGLVLFGSRDGWVYCLRSTDGALVWRYRGVPNELRVMVYGQLESAWPVSGSVLIENGEMHCVAGRNMFMDGGLRYLRLDPVTGKKISETLMGQDDPLNGGSIEQHDTWLDMTTTLPDVLSSDGNTIYMRSLPFDMKGKRKQISHIAKETEAPHLFSPTGFLDDNWFHRSYWTYGRTFPGGWIGHLNAGRYNPSGRLLVMDDSTIYGFGRKPEYYQWTTSLEYRMFAVDKATLKTKDIYAWDKYKEAHLENFPSVKIDKNIGLPSGPRPELKNSYPCKWQVNDMPLLVLAMVSTPDQLFIAGPKDVSDEETFFFRDAAAAYQQKEAELKKQDQVWSGDEGAILAVLSKKDGKMLAQYKLTTLPIFDGMIAARGKLFVSLKDGSLVCMEGNREFAETEDLR